MKDRVREALFNLLGKAVEGKVAIDLFAGTGALGLEALSRKASRAIFIERHRPTAETIRRNAATLGVEAIVDVTAADTFLWAKRLPDLGSAPWLVFCSPPYELYVSQKDDMLQILKHLTEVSLPESLFAVEADNRFDFHELPDADHWDIRPYPPAILGIWEKEKE
jgi:16S rRNA (guanine966-N2)-methyltransferase